MTRKPGSMYREIRGQAYARKEYMGGVPGIRISQFDIGDLRTAFGAPVGTAARVKPGTKVFTISTTEDHVDDAKEALRKGGVKLPTPWRLVIERPKKKR